MKHKYSKPKDTDWLKVTFDGTSHVCRDWDMVLKLAQKKNGNKKGEYYRDGDKVLFYEKKLIGKWKHERFSDRACTKPVRV